MPRQLRTRTSRPNYALLAGFQDNNIDDGDAGPSNRDAQPIESDDSGSEFEVPPEEQVQADEAEDMEPDDDALLGNEAELDESVSVAAKPRRNRRGPEMAASTQEPSVDTAITETMSVARKRKKSQPKAPPRRSVMLAPGLAHPSNRQMHALPSYSHRHRAVGIYKKKGRIERLARLPALSVPDLTVPTNAWAESTVISERIGKAWGFNIGPGPLWELLEDRAWFKESYGSSGATERECRPRVHLNISLGHYQLLTPLDAEAYLPTDVETTDEGALKPPPPVACSFGPFGKQTRLEVNMFDAVKISDFFSESKAHVFNAGGPAWGLDWCPIHPDDRAHHQYRQYLAVAPFPSRNHSPLVGSSVQRPTPACIQIWSLGPSSPPGDAMDVDEAGSTNETRRAQEDAGEVCCEMILCVDCGPAFEVKWCPLPAGDPIVDDSIGDRKLGIIGGTFEDGSLTFYTVPDPRTVAKSQDQPVGTPVFVKLTKPLLRIELEETCCWCFDWANSEVVAIGCTNGCIAVYNIAQALRGVSSTQEPLLPTHYFTVHQSAIRSLSWVRAPTYSGRGEETADDPTVIASGGYDGVECITDIREMSGNVMNRTRDVVTSMAFSTYCGSAITIDHENTIKAYSVSPSMLGRGHMLLEPNGPIWSLGASDHHPQVAVGVTDGSCMTTNMMRSTRRGGSVPFLEHKIYQLDYSRSLGEYRMLEHFLPKETHNRPAASRANQTLPVGTGAWPPEVGVQRVVWNDGNGLGRAPLLASATASGLCRIDWLLGRWVRDPPPYNGVEGIRDETGTADNYDEDEESDG